MPPTTPLAASPASSHVVNPLLGLTPAPIIRLTFRAALVQVNYVQPDFPAYYAVMLMLQMPVVGMTSYEPRKLFEIEAGLLTAFTNISGAPTVNVVRAYTKWAMHGRGNDAIQVCATRCLARRWGGGERTGGAVRSGGSPLRQRRRASHRRYSTADTLRRSIWRSTARSDHTESSGQGVYASARRTSPDEAFFVSVWCARR